MVKYKDKYLKYKKKYFNRKKKKIFGGGSEVNYDGLTVAKYEQIQSQIKKIFSPVPTKTSGWFLFTKEVHDTSMLDSNSICLVKTGVLKDNAANLENFLMPYFYAYKKNEKIEYSNTICIGSTDYNMCKFPNQGPDSPIYEVIDYYIPHYIPIEKEFDDSYKIIIGNEVYNYKEITNEGINESLYSIC